MPAPLPPDALPADLAEGLELVVLDPTDPADDALWCAWADVFHRVELADLGDSSAFSAQEQRAYALRPGARRWAVAAVRGSEVVGAVELICPTRDNLTQARGSLAVLPAHRGVGTGGALLRAGTALARGQGRTHAWLSTSSTAPGDGPGGSFLRHHGATPTLTGARRDLTLPLDPAHLTGLQAEVSAALDGLYVIHTTTDDHPPAAWVDDLAVLSTRMSTDAPQGDMEGVLEEERWDAERVEAEWARTRAQHRLPVTAVAEHAATGRLVGVTRLECSLHAPAEGPWVAYQQDTLVLREHRGHRLGLALKLATAEALASAPDVAPTLIRTWNADSNAPMVAVNRTLGFVESQYFTEWMLPL